MKNRAAIIESVDLISADVVGLAKRIFEFSELSYEEYKSAETLIDFLKDKGFSVESPAIEELPTSFIASYGGSGPRVAVMAEYDALPEIGHACGHNLICTTSIAAAVALKDSGAIDNAGGTVVVVGCPAEERGGAKRVLVEKGVFDDMSAAIIIHPASMSTGFDISYALKTFSVEYFGKAAHAAADPAKGVNALDAVIQMFNGISAMRQQLPEKVRVHGIITNGGQSFNTIPDYSSAEIGIRALTMEEVDEVSEKFRRVVEAGALATGCEFLLKQTEQMEEVYVNVPIARLLDKNFESAGEETTPRTYEQGVGSTDVGSVTHVLPAIQGYIDITGGKDIPTHTKEFASCASSEYGYKAMLRAAKAMALTVYDLLSDQSVLKEAVDYFEERRKEF